VGEGKASSASIKLRDQWPHVNYVPWGVYGMGVTHVARPRLINPDIADAGSERTLLTFDQPQSNHNGG
jgi:hypothetical protein